MWGSGEEDCLKDIVLLSARPNAGAGMVEGSDVQSEEDGGPRVSPRDSCRGHQNTLRITTNQAAIQATANPKCPSDLTKSAIRKPSNTDEELTRLLDRSNP